MKSLTYKLSGLFLIISLVPLMIGLSGASSLQTARQSLDANNAAMGNLSKLISSAGESLSESIKTQANSHAVTGQIAKSQTMAGGAFKEMEETLLPRVFSLSQVRYQMYNAGESKTAMFLLLNMRHLDTRAMGERLDVQRKRLEASMNGIDEACDAYRRLMRNTEGEEAWNELEENLHEWRGNHDEFMEDIERLSRLANDLVRGGPLFAAASRKAYDTLFVKGVDARIACEASIENLNRTITNLANGNVHRAMQSQDRSLSLMDDLTRDSESVSAKAEELRKQIESAGNMSDDAVRQSAAAMTSTANRYRRMIIFSVIGIAAALAVGISLAVRISRPIIAMADHMTRLAKGDLGGDVAAGDMGRNDEIGQLARALQSMIDSSRSEIRLANAMAAGDYTQGVTLRSDSDQLGLALRTVLSTANDVILGVSSAINRMGRGAAAVTETSRSLSQGAMTSATALEEISRSIGNVDQQAKENAGQARLANDLATASRDAAQRGYDAVNELVAAMKEIRQSGKRIATVAKLIDDIAFQTNLLALNAAVEAARAGRHGKGFSVVADEVRNLSGRSARAAKETGDMVTAMTERMEAGAILAARTDQEFREIVAATDQVAAIFNDIATASNDQSQAMAQITVGLNQIDSVIQKNTLDASETASSAQSFLEQTERLRHAVARFRLVDSEAGAARLRNQPISSILEGSPRRPMLPLAAEPDAPEPEPEP